MLYIRVLAVFLVVLSLPRLQAQEGSRLAPHNIIFIVGDGMGPEHVRATRLWRGSSLSFEDFPYLGWVTTYSADSSVTDSAAAATALATGHKVNNGVISLALPGDGSELQTLLEYFKARGKSTGLVVTSNLTDATPAAFGAHANSRGNTTEIAADFLNQTKPTIILGGGGVGMSTATAAAAGYTVVTDNAGLLALDTEAAGALSGQFGDGNMPYETDGMGSLPHLSTMVQRALNILDNNPNGFFLLVEGALIDKAAHTNNLVRVVGETNELSNTVTQILNWLPEGSETLLIVTADHETGGLRVTDETLQGGYPAVSWSSTGHTAANVRVYAKGYGAEQFSGTPDNTDFFSLITTAGRIYNQAPEVNAGSDMNLVLTNGSGRAQLNGLVTDDDISSPAGITLQWSQVSGPAEADIANSASAITDISFNTTGTYVFSLSAHDGFATGSDSLQITVSHAQVKVSLSASLKSDKTGFKVLSRTVRKDSQGQNLSLSEAACVLSLHLLSAASPRATAANRLLRAATNGQKTISLPHFYAKKYRSIPKPYRVWLKAIVRCGSAEEGSHSAALTRIWRSDYANLIRYWRQRATMLN